MLYALDFWLGVAAGGAAVWFLPKVKAWFSNEETAIASVVKAHI